MSDEDFRPRSTRNVAEDRKLKKKLFHQPSGLETQTALIDQELNDAMADIQIEDESSNADGEKMESGHRKTARQPKSATDKVKQMEEDVIASIELSPGFGSKMTSAVRPKSKKTIGQRKIFVLPKPTTDKVEPKQDDEDVNPEINKMSVMRTKKVDKKPAAGNYKIKLVENFIKKQQEAIEVEESPENESNPKVEEDTLPKPTTDKVKPNLEDEDMIPEIKKISVMRTKKVDKKPASGNYKIQLESYIKKQQEAIEFEESPENKSKSTVQENTANKNPKTMSPGSCIVKTKIPVKVAESPMEKKTKPTDEEEKIAARNQKFKLVLKKCTIGEQKTTVEVEESLEKKAMPTVEVKKIAAKNHKISMVKSFSMKPETAVEVEMSKEKKTQTEFEDDKSLEKPVVKAKIPEKENEDPVGDEAPNTNTVETGAVGTPKKSFNVAALTKTRNSSPRRTPTPRQCKDGYYLRMRQN